MNIIETWKRKIAFAKIRRSPSPKRLSNTTNSELAIIVSIESPKDFLKFKDFYKFCQKKYDKVKAIVYTDANYSLSTLSGMTAIKKSDCDIWGIPKKSNRVNSFLGTYFDILVDLDVNNFPISSWFAKNAQARLKFKYGEPELDVYDVILTSHETWYDVMKEIDRFYEQGKLDN